MPPPAPGQLSRIFISYRRDDSAGHAGRIFDGLAAHFGQDQLFMDVDHIEPGQDFVEVLEKKLDSCEILLAVIGRHWLVGAGEVTRRLDNPDDFVRFEVASALRRGVIVIPVLVQGASMPRSDELPDELKPLSRRNAVEVRDLHWTADLRRLTNALARRLAERAEEREKREAEARLQAEQEAEQLRLAEEARLKAEAEEAARQREREVEEARERKAEAERRRRAEAERLRLAEEEKRRNEAAAAAQAAEEQRARAAEEARRRAAEAERRRADGEAGGRNGELAGRAASPASADSRTGSKRKWVKWGPLAAAVVLALIAVVVFPVWRRESPPRPNPTPTPLPTATPESTPTPTPTPAPTPHPEAVKLSQQATELVKRGRYDEAIRKGTEALKLPPPYAYAYTIRGIAFASRKQYDNAIVDLTAAIRLNPKAALAYVNRGAAYNATRRYEAAVEDSTEAIELASGDRLLKASAYVICGAAYSNLGQWGRAVDALTSAISLDPENALAYEFRAVVYKKMDKKELADADTRQVKRLKR